MGRSSKGKEAGRQAGRQAGGRAGGRAGGLGEGVVDNVSPVWVTHHYGCLGGCPALIWSGDNGAVAAHPREVKRHSQSRSSDRNYSEA